VAGKTLLRLLVTTIAALCLNIIFKHVRNVPHKGASSMAWRSSGSSNAGLINNLAANGLITSDRVRKAMLAVRTLPLLQERTQGSVF